MPPKCPHCGHDLKLKNGKYGWFLGCPNFHKLKCKYGLNLPPDIQKELDQDPEMELDFTGLLPKEGVDCPDCGEALVLRYGEYGFFHGCLGYPKCKYTVEIPEEGVSEEPEEPEEPEWVPIKVTSDVELSFEQAAEYHQPDPPPVMLDVEDEPKPRPDLPTTDILCPHCNVQVKFERGWSSFMYRCVRNGCHKWQANEDGSFKIDLIYGLYDTRPGKEGLRYVGQTATTLKKRLAGHINDSRKKGATDPRSIWIKEMRDEGYRPDIQQLEEVPSIHKDVSEQMWMSVALDCEIDLTNRVIGGADGSWVFSDRLKEVQRAREHERYLARCERAGEDKKNMVLTVDIPPEVAVWLEKASFLQDPSAPARKTKSEIITQALLEHCVVEAIGLVSNLE
jgi:ssDNA-binding Zn-finger/Zn-ribbon topoisomerase 1